MNTPLLDQEERSYIQSTARTITNPQAHASCGPALTSEAAPVETISCTSGTARCFLGAPASRRLPSREIDLPNKSDRSESSLITSNSTENPTFYENRNFDPRIVIVREDKECVHIQ